MIVYRVSPDLMSPSSSSDTVSPSRSIGHCNFHKIPDSTEVPTFSGEAPLFLDAIIQDFGIDMRNKIEKPPTTMSKLGLLSGVKMHQNSEIGKGFKHPNVASCVLESGQNAILEES